MHSLKKQRAKNIYYIIKLTTLLKKPFYQITSNSLKLHPRLSPKIITFSFQYKMYVDKPVNGHQKERKPVTVPRLLEMKQKGEKITMLTSYDASLTYHMERAGVDLILVGDSLGMVVQGHESTLPVTVENIVYHCQAVRRSVQNILLIADLPFQAASTFDDALKASVRFLSEAGAAMIKLEGGSELTLEIIRQLTKRSIPVCAHLGLTPQSVHALGGYKVQGKNVDVAERIIREAHAVQQAGASLLVLECVPEKLAEQITNELKIPTIGIGAGVKCDGQVLVVHDILGITPGRKSKFVKNFLTGRDSIHDAIEAYVQEVHEGTFSSRRAHIPLTLCCEVNKVYFDI
ncbi:3-methyl-2-oxobutanoate hydroxymethyltransferase [Aphelenchoides bicaudatus]|nr:3-methyl-2-oxobutanoate hydroxymethyltransferase [Aphelenchoides bicaudatus]